jgi:hypothetical protein
MNTMVNDVYHLEIKVHENISEYYTHLHIYRLTLGVQVEWLATLLHVLDNAGSNIGPEAG